MSVVGRWRIVDMELWDQAAVDLVAPGFIEFETESIGCLGFIAVQGGMNWREAPREGRPGVDRLYFHLGDDSGFHAARLMARPH